MVDALLARGDEVTVYDNLGSGRTAFIEHNLANPKFKLVKGDLLDREQLKTAMQENEMVFHFAAHADVREGVINTRIDLDQNAIGTYNVLESMRELGIKKIMFASTSAIYGSPDVVPTPEDTYTKAHTSLYGASKLFCEGMIQTFSFYYGIQAWIFRFVSYVGERYTHGVVFDFMRKLEQNPKELEVLGDGTAKKSFMYVGDGIKGMLTAIEKAKDPVNTFNLGYDGTITVTEIAKVVCDAMELKDVKFNYTGGASGWKGDAPYVHLAVDKIHKLGWKAQMPIPEALTRTVHYLKAHPEVLHGREMGAFAGEKK